MEAQMLFRQSDILPVALLGEKITIIGAGAIGSFTALALTKMGFSDITVYDFDSIETENMNCQFYPLDAIGSKKVDALKAMIQMFSGVDIDVKCEEYKQGAFSGIVISAVDSMTVRKLIYDNHKCSPMTKFIIDPRMGAEVGLMYVMNPTLEKDQASYEKTLYSDESAMPERCTAKSTVYTALLMSGVIAKAVKDIVTASPYTRTLQWAIKENVMQVYTGALA